MFSGSSRILSEASATIVASSKQCSISPLPPGFGSGMLQSDAKASTFLKIASKSSRTGSISVELTFLISAYNFTNSGVKF